MKMQTQEVANALPNLEADGMLLVAIDGCGGAGKSTFADELSLNLGNSQVVHIDDFYKPKDERIPITDSTPLHSNFEFDRLKQQVIEPLRHGTPSTYQTANNEEIEVIPRGYVIIEGLGTLGTELRDFFDYKIWIDAIETVRRKRGIERDTEEWTKIWDEEYLPQDARYMREQRPQDKADWTVTNN